MLHAFTAELSSWWLRFNFCLLCRFVYRFWFELLFFLCFSFQRIDVVTVKLFNWKCKLDRDRTNCNRGNHESIAGCLKNFIETGHWNRL